MAFYKVLQRSFVDNRIVEPGEIVEITFPKGSKGAGPNLALCDSNGNEKATKPLTPEEEAALAVRIARDAAAAANTPTGVKPA